MYLINLLLSFWICLLLNFIKNKDNQQNKYNNDEGQKAPQHPNTSLNPGRIYKPYTDQGNKNSVLFQFRSEINKSQQIVDREVEKTAILKNKYSRKRIMTTELRMRSNFFNSNNNENNKIINNKFGKFNIQNNFKNLDNNNIINNDSHSVLSKFKTGTGFFKSESNNGDNNNFFNTQIKTNVNNNKNENQANYFISHNHLNTPDKNKIDSHNPGSNQDIKSNPINLKIQSRTINQLNPFSSMASLNNNLNSNAANRNDNAADEINKPVGGFNATSDYFFRGSKITSNRIKSYNVYFITNWFDKNQIPFHNYTPHMVSNIEFQSNTIIDQMKVLLDNLNYFKIQFLQGKNVNFFNRLLV